MDQKDSEEMPTQHDEFWRHIFTTQQAGIVVSVDGFIRQMNHTAVTMFCGHSESDFIGKRFHEALITSEYIARIQERERQLLSGHSSLPPWKSVRNSSTVGNWMFLYRRHRGGVVAALLSNPC